MRKSPSFSVGIEEEYHLIDRQTYNLINKIPDGFWRDIKREIGDKASPEFLQCQVEIGTKVCDDMATAKQELVSLRHAVADIAHKYDIGLMAASTHPFAENGQQSLTDNYRYLQLQEDLQKVVRRLLISGMHVHVGLDDDDLRVDLMSQVTYILPHLLALSTSSPFWDGEDTGLKSYRTSVWNGMPRTGLPTTTFDSYGDYMRHINVLVDSGIIEDASKIWWDLRPSNKYSTLEMRITDVCTHVDDAVAIAAIYRSWLHMLYRLRLHNQRWRRYQNFLIEENRWRAHRYGIDQGLLDFGMGKIKPYEELLLEMVDLIKEDAIELGCLKEVEHGFTILRNGTSAHRQLTVFNQAMDTGKTKHDALVDVVKHLEKETLMS